jgi:hypothetical protein
MALNNLGLGFVFTARDLASAKMTHLKRQFGSLDEQVTEGTARMSSAFRQLGVGLAVFTAGVGVSSRGSRPSSPSLAPLRSTYACFATRRSCSGSPTTTRTVWCCARAR